MKKIVMTIVLAATLTNVQAEQASEESIKNLLDKVNAGQLGVQVMQKMVPSLKQMLPNVPASFWQEMTEKAKPEDLVALIVPIYQRHLSQSDVVAISHFYTTEAGKNLLKAQPLIVQESMKVGQQWGQDMAKEIIAEYKKRYQK